MRWYSARPPRFSPHWMIARGRGMSRSEATACSTARPCLRESVAIADATRPTPFASTSMYAGCWTRPAHWAYNTNSTAAELRARTLRAAVASGLSDQYLRAVLYCGQPRLGVDLGCLRYSFGVEVWPSTPDFTGRGLRLTISSWHRPGRSSFPVGTKATGIYVTSAIAKTQAVQRGFDDAIQLDPDSGRVAEATIANVFLVRNGRLATPCARDSLLPGITRDSVLVLAGTLGVEAGEEPVTVDDLKNADEVFLTGTAIGMVAVASVDERMYPLQRPVYDVLNNAYAAAVTERGPCPAGWLTPLVAPAYLDA